MLALQHPPSPPRTLTPNLLPTRLSHTGPIKISKRYWNPRPLPSPSPTPSSSSSQTHSNPTPSSTKVAYFRGRRLLSRTLRVPSGYQGYIVSKTEARLEKTKAETASTLEENGEGSRRLPVVSAKLPVLGAWGDGEGESEGEDGDEDPLRRMMMMEKKKTAEGEGKGSREEGGEGETRVLEVKGVFDEMLIWGHEEVVGYGDGFVRGVEEWMEMARVMHED